eukprot:jgi/Bigna1/135919/aug1.31_g10627
MAKEQTSTMSSGGSSERIPVVSLFILLLPRLAATGSNNCSNELLMHARTFERIAQLDLLYKADNQPFCSLSSDRWNLDDLIPDPGDAERSEANQRLAELIYRIQNPLKCSEARFLVARHWSIDCGFGADMHVLSVALHVSLMLNRTLIVDDEDWWWFREGMASTRSNFEFNQSMGKLWYRSKLMQFLLKPTKMMQNHIQILTNRLNLRAVKTRTEGKDDDEDNDNNDYDDGDDDDDHDREDTNDEEEDVSAFGVSYIGVHIRRGDNYENPNHPFKKYSRGVKLLQKEYPKIQKVFLASDDQNAVEDGRERGWKALVNERRYRGEVKGKHGLASDGLRFYDLPSGFAESWDFFPMVFDLMLLAQSSHLVVSLGSNFGRLAFEIAHALKPGTEVVTLDEPYTYFK